MRPHWSWQYKLVECDRCLKKRRVGWGIYRPSVCGECRSALRLEAFLARVKRSIACRVGLPSSLVTMECDMRNYSAAKSAEQRYRRMIVEPNNLQTGIQFSD